MDKTTTPAALHTQRKWDSGDNQNKERADREEKSTTPLNVVSDEFDLELRNGKFKIFHS